MVPPVGALKGGRAIVATEKKTAFPQWLHVRRTRGQEVLPVMDIPWMSIAPTTPCARKFVPWQPAQRSAGALALIQSRTCCRCVGSSVMFDLLAGSACPVALGRSTRHAPGRPAG